MDIVPRCIKRFILWIRVEVGVRSRQEWDDGVGVCTMLMQIHLGRFDVVFLPDNILLFLVWIER